MKISVPRTEYDIQVTFQLNSFHKPPIIKSSGKHSAFFCTWKIGNLVSSIVTTD